MKKFKFSDWQLLIILWFAFLMGVFAPLILGILKPTLGLSLSFSSLSIFYVTGSILIFTGLKVWFRKEYVDDNNIIPKL